MSEFRVWHIPQVPGSAFWRDMPDLATARLVVDLLADYDLFQFDNDIKPDYCNVSGIPKFVDGEWEDVDDDGDE